MSIDGYGNQALFFKGVLAFNQIFHYFLKLQEEILINKNFVAQSPFFTSGSIKMNENGNDLQLLLLIELSKYVHGISLRFKIYLTNI